MKIAKVTFLVFFLCFLGWSPCLSQEQSTSSSSSSSSSAKIADTSDRVFYTIFSYVSEEKLPLEKVMKMKVVSCFLKGGKPIYIGAYFTIEELFHQICELKKLDPRDYTIVSVQGIIYNSQPGDVTVWFMFVPKE